MPSYTIRTRNDLPFFLLSSPGPKPLSPKPKTKGPWADSKILLFIMVQGRLVIFLLSTKNFLPGVFFKSSFLVSLISLA